MSIKLAALVLRALNHKLRQSILTVIRYAGRMTVTEIYAKLRLEQSVASQHLAILRKQGMVKTDRDGKFIYYTVNEDRVTEITTLAEKLVPTKKLVLETA